MDAVGLFEVGRATSWKSLLRLASCSFAVKSLRRIQEPDRSKRKATLFRKIGCEYFIMVLWYGKSLKEVRGKIFIVSWRLKQRNNYTKSQRHALMTTNSKKKNWGHLEDCQQFAHKSSRKCLCLARIGTPDILWSVNKLARTVTKSAKACDKR